MTCDKEFSNQSNGIELILNSIMQSDLFKTFLNYVTEQRISTLMHAFIEEVAVLKEKNEIYMWRGTEVNNNIRGSVS